MDYKKRVVENLTELLKSNSPYGKIVYNIVMVGKLTYGE